MNVCDHGHDTKKEIRRLPLGGNGNVLVCHEHYEQELRFRQERIDAGAMFDLPTWESLKIYAPAERGI